MSEETATPKGNIVLVSAIKPEDVSISHRKLRPIFDRKIKNQGSTFTSDLGKRTGYDEHLDWPIINTFPSRDIAYEPTAEDAQACISGCCVLPDYWKYHVLRLNLTKRFELWKLDFSKSGWLAQNYTPHGAPAVKRDKNGVLKFVVWNGFQMHGDLGARLGYDFKLPRARFRELIGDPNSEGQTMKKGMKDEQNWCLGMECPSNYQLPPDWDVQGILPPRKKRKSASSTSQTISFPAVNIYPEKITKRAKGKDRFKPDFSALPLGNDYRSEASPDPPSHSPLTDMGDAPSTAPGIASLSEIPGNETVLSVQVGPTAIASTSAGNSRSMNSGNALPSTSPGDVTTTTHNLSSAALDKTLCESGGFSLNNIDSLSTNTLENFNFDEWLHDTEKDGSWDTSFSLPVETSAPQGAQNESPSTTPEENKEHRLPKYPKLRIPVTETEDSEEVTRLKAQAVEAQARITELEEENVQFRKTLDYADQKIRAVVRFSANQDNVVGFMAYQFNSWETATKPEHRTQIKKEINTAIESAESAGVELGIKYPYLEELVTLHGGEVKESDVLEKWLAQEDHIGYPKGS